jgi:RNA polymerase sigma factor (sigma-70 family)
VSATQPVVYIVDDEASVRRSMSRLMGSVGLTVKSFASGDEFLRYRRPDTPACLVLDVRMPGPSGLDVQQRLSADTGLPVIFVTGHGDVPMSVRAMKAGAADFLTKPFNDQTLLDAIYLALERSRTARDKREERREINKRLSLLTPRERQVFDLVVQGLLNKQIGSRLGTSEKTVKVHRARVMRKMGAWTIVDLVKMAERLPA